MRDGPGFNQLRLVSVIFFWMTTALSFPWTVLALSKRQAFSLSVSACSLEYSLDPDPLLSCPPAQPAHPSLGSSSDCCVLLQSSSLYALSRSQNPECSNSKILKSSLLTLMSLSFILCSHFLQIPGVVLAQGVDLLGLHLVWNSLTTHYLLLSGKCQGVI